MDRRMFLAGFGAGLLSLAALGVASGMSPAFAKGGGGGGSSGGGSSDHSDGGANGGEAASKSDDRLKQPGEGENEDGQNNDDQPDPDAQPEDATGCAAGINCKKE